MTAESRWPGFELVCGCRAHSHMRRCVACGEERHAGDKGAVSEGYVGSKRAV
jgi:hypothetical protein